VLWPATMEWINLEQEIDALPDDLLADHSEAFEDSRWKVEDSPSDVVEEENEGVTGSLEFIAPSSSSHGETILFQCGGSSTNSSSANSSFDGNMSRAQESQAFSPAATIEIVGAAAEQKKRNAAASRKLREKRKAERDALQLRVSAIEGENHLLLKRIALLQNEVQSLRCGHGAGLAKENALLRAEIKRHKVFMQRMVHAVHEHDSQNDEALLRVYYSGIRSTLSRSLGLLHTSSHDPSWRREEIPTMDLGDLGQCPIDCIYIQTLPLGAPKDRIKLANVRVDCNRIPVTKDDLLERVNAFYTDVDTSTAMFKYFKQVDQRDRIWEKYSSPGLDEVCRILAKEGQELKIFTYAEERFEVLNYCSTSKSEINLSATRPRHEYGEEQELEAGVTNEKPEIVEADITMISTISTMLAKAIVPEPTHSSVLKSSKSRKPLPAEEAADFQESITLYNPSDGAPDQCSLIYMGSLPINPELNILTEFYLEDDGQSCLSFRQMLLQYISLLTMAPDSDLDGWKAALISLAA